MENFSIKTRNGNIIGNILKTNSEKLVIIVHGIGGKRQDQHIKFLENYFSKKYNVISYDSSHSLGESSGDYFDATAKIYYENLEDIISFGGIIFGAKKIILIGHSIGGLCAGTFAQKSAEKVEKLILISSVINSKFFEQALGEKIVGVWKKDGFYDSLIGTDICPKPKLGYNFLLDLKNFDLVENAQKIKAKTFVIVGDKDFGVPIKYQKIFFEKLRCNKQFFVLKDTGHFVKKDFQFLQLEKILEKI